MGMGVMKKPRAIIRSKRRIQEIDKIKKPRDITRFKRRIQEIFGRIPIHVESFNKIGTQNSKVGTTISLVNFLLHLSCL